MKLGEKSKNGAHSWDRETLRALHDSGLSDAQIADLFGCSDALVTFGRKRESFWNEMSEPAKGEATNSPESVEPPKAKLKTKKKDNES